MNVFSISFFNSFFTLSIFSVVTTFLISYLLIPLIINFGSRFDILDIPDKRKQHKVPLVRLGGLGIAAASLSTFYFFNKIAINNSIYTVDENTTNIILISSISMLSIGILDDIYSLSPWPRLALQIAIASFTWSNGISLDNINFIGLINQENFIELPSYISLIFTVIWIVGFTNALNWIDGIDGLAISLVSIAFLGNLILLILVDNLELILFLIIVLISCLVFMKFNLKPSKIIMGDGGCYFLGYFLATISILAATNENKITMIVSPVLFFSVPIFDMAVVICKRIFSSRSPFHGDRKHIHHTLLDKNFRENEIVLLLSSISQCSLILGLKLYTQTINWISLLISSLIMVFVISKISKQ